MKPRLLLLAAPFGFGPASKALMVAQALHAAWDVTIVSARDAVRFIDRFKPADVRCLEGDLQPLPAESTALRAFDAFVSINHEPAVHQLVKLGLARRTIFFDSILPWRAIHSPGGFSEPILAYLVQDFPGTARHLDLCRAEHVRLTAPMIWASANEGAATAHRGDVVVHLGGVTSPLADWSTMATPVGTIVGQVSAIAARHDRAVQVVGSHHLSTLTVPDPRCTLLGDVSPPEMAALLRDADLLVTTPGLGAIYEALALRVPVVLLPPMNSTQLHQYLAFTAEGLAGSCATPYHRVLTKGSQTLAWDRQTAFCIEGLERRLAEGLGRLPSHMHALLATDAQANRETTLARQDTFIGGLSHADAIDILLGLLADLGR